MEHAIGILDVLKSAPTYIVVFALAAMVLTYGTSRKFRVEPRYRKVLNPIGISLIVVGVLLIIWDKVSVMVGG